MANKKRNNLVCKKGWWYYRLCWGTGGVNHKEKTIPLKTQSKEVANKRGKKVDAIADDVRNGVYREEQIKDLLPWLNDQGTYPAIDKFIGALDLRFQDFSNLLKEKDGFKKRDNEDITF